MNSEVEEFEQVVNVFDTKRLLENVEEHQGRTRLMIIHVGIGFGLVYLPSLVIVSHYFDSKRAMATGIAVCGSGIGTIIFAWVSIF